MCIRDRVVVVVVVVVVVDDDDVAVVIVVVVGCINLLTYSRAIREVFADKGREQVTNDRPRTFSGWFTMYNFSDIIMGSPHHPGWAKLRKLFHSSIRSVCHYFMMTSCGSS